MSRAARSRARQDAARFLEPLHPLAEGGTARPYVVLLLEPFGAEADLDPAVRDPVDRRRDLGEERRVATGIGRDHQPAAYRLDGRGAR